MAAICTKELLTEGIRRIAVALNPEKIYLFGSHAWGVPTPDSDIDLFVIVKESQQSAYRRSREAYRSLRGLREPFEVIVRTISEVEKSKTVTSSLVKKFSNKENYCMDEATIHEVRQWLHKADHDLRSAALLCQGMKNRY